MQHDEAQEVLAAYVLDALPEDERQAVEDHVRGCAECRRALAGLLPTAAALPLALEPVSPPVALRRRIIAEISGARAPEPLRRSPRLLDRPIVGWLAAAVFFLAALGLGGWGAAEHQQLYSAQVALAGTGPAGSAQGRLVSQPGRLPTVYVADLAAPPPDTVYEAWVIHAGAPQAAGIFITSPAGLGGVALTRSPAPGDQVVITREPAPGGAAPSGPAVRKGEVA